MIEEWENRKGKRIEEKIGNDEESKEVVEEILKMKERERKELNGIENMDWGLEKLNNVVEEKILEMVKEEIRKNKVGIGFKIIIIEEEKVKLENGGEIVGLGMWGEEGEDDERVRVLKERIENWMERMEKRLRSKWEGVEDDREVFKSEKKGRVGLEINKLRLIGVEEE